MKNKNSQDDILTLNPAVGLSMDDVLAAGREAIRQSMLQPAILIEQTTKLWRNRQVRVVIHNLFAVMPDHLFWRDKHR